MTGIDGVEMREEIGEIVLAVGREQNLRRAAGAKPGERRERLIGDQPPAQIGHRRLQARRDVGKAHGLPPSACNSPGSA